MQIEIINADKKIRYNFGDIWALVQPYLKGGMERAYEDDHRLCDQNGSVPR